MGNCGPGTVEEQLFTWVGDRARVAYSVNGVVGESELWYDDVDDAPRICVRPEDGAIVAADHNAASFAIWRYQLIAHALFGVGLVVVIVVIGHGWGKWRLGVISRS